MTTILIITVIVELAIVAGGQFKAALSRPSRRARLNLN